MASKRDTDKIIPWPNQPTVDMYQRQQRGWNGDKKSVYPYSGYELKATPLLLQGGRPLVVSAASHSSMVAEFYAGGGVPSYSQAAANKAYAKFKDAALGENAQIGTAIAEARESFGMIANRAIGLRFAYSALRRGRLVDALAHLSVSPRNRHRKLSAKAVANNASSIWLEYWFGWSPMIGDMHSAMQVLSQPLPGGRYHGQSGERRVLQKTATLSSRNGYLQKGVLYHKTGGDVYLVNPNQFLLNQLGIANPASIAWELIPFSFVVDWVTKTGQFIESWTDFMGCELSNTYRTHHLKVKTAEYWNTERYTNVEIQRTKITGVCTIRKEGLIRPLPNLNVLRNVGQRATRTATAVSLLLQVLTKA